MTDQDPGTASARLSATRARQGRRGKPVAWILAISTVLAIVALFSVWGWRSDDLASAEAERATTAAEAATQDTPPSSVRQTTADPPATQ
jgi:hypothetical protein